MVKSLKKVAEDSSTIDTAILARAVIKLWYEATIEENEEKVLRNAIERAGYDLSEDGLYDIFNQEDKSD